IQIANGVDHTADFEQGIQVSPYPRAGGQLILDLIGMKVDHVLRVQLRRGVSNHIIEFNSSACRIFSVVGQLQNEHRIPDGNLVAMLEPGFFYRLPIYEGPIAAVEIADPVPLSLVSNDAMTPGNGRVGDAE